MPATVQEIGNGAFSGCTALKSINLTSGVTRIGVGTFLRCVKLKLVTFESSSKLRVIAGSAFRDCYALEEIVIPPTVTEIGPRSFGYCSSLKKVDSCGGSPVLMRGLLWGPFEVCPNLEHGSIIATGKMTFYTFKLFATADITRRIESMSGVAKQ